MGGVGDDSPPPPPASRIMTTRKLRKLRLLSHRVHPTLRQASSHDLLSTPHACTPRIANSLARLVATRETNSSWRTRLLPLSWTSASFAPRPTSPQHRWLTYSNLQRHGLFQAWYAGPSRRCASLEDDADIMVYRFRWKRLAVLCLPDCHCDQRRQCRWRRLRLWPSCCRQQALLLDWRCWSRQQSFELKARNGGPRLFHWRRGHQRRRRPW